MGTGPRMLIAETDSPAQAARFDRRDRRGRRDPQAAIAEITGMLRIGMLISGRVLVTDAMLLDGEYFMTLGPDGVLRELGGSESRYPLVVTGVHDSLRAGLDARLADDGFRWSLRQVVHGRTAPEDVRRTWEEWVRCAERGIIRYEKQDRPPAPVPVGAAPVRSPEHLQHLHDAKLGEIRRRSEALDRIDRLPWDEDARADVRRWWNDGYLRLIAENASADWVTFESDAEHAPLERAGDVELPLSQQLVTWARTSTPATIAVAWDATVAQRARLHERPTWWRMRTLAFAATQVSSAPSRSGVLAGSVLKLFAAVVVIVLALPVISIGAAENPWTWVAFAGAIATTVPFDALRSLLALAAPDEQVRLVLHRGGSS